MDHTDDPDDEEADVLEDVLNDLWTGPLNARDDLRTRLGLVPTIRKGDQDREEAL